MAELSLDRGLELLGRRARAARGALFLFPLVSLGMSVASIGETGMMDLASGYADAQTVIDLLYIGYVFGYFGCAFLVAMWIYRAHANLRAADVGGLEFSPGGAIIAYFIPILSLYRPFQAMRELWRASLLDAESSQSHATGQLGLWWAAWLGSSVVGLATSLGGAEVGLAINIVALALDVVAALLLANIIGTITEGQTGIMSVAEVFA